MGYQVGARVQGGGAFEFVEQNREDYYASTHLQTIQFEIARQIVHDLEQGARRARPAHPPGAAAQVAPPALPAGVPLRGRVRAAQGRLPGANPCELGLQKYVERIVERLRDAIQPDDTEGEPPLLPLLNRYKPIGTTADVDFKTTRPCFGHAAQPHQPGGRRHEDLGEQRRLPAGAGRPAGQR